MKQISKFIPLIALSCISCTIYSSHTSYYDPRTHIYQQTSPNSFLYKTMHHFETSTRMIEEKNMSVSVIPLLKDIFIYDDTTRLAAFIIVLPHFNWTDLYANCPFGANQGTPLIAATWYGAVNCIKLLFTRKPYNFMTSINVLSGHKYTALKYAQNPPRVGHFSNQTPANFAQITQLLINNGAQ